MIGQQLGPYRVLDKLGEGGMGEVYRARDTRLNRSVAIKVLPPAFCDDPDRRARFDREAQTVAALSHPNIVNLFDTGVHDGQVFVVMELLDGETLRERLAGGALPARKSIDIATQVARGLAAAHGKGVIHRDLKPDNIFLLADGQVKVLDFGLARQVDDASGGARTVAVITNPGTVMGTVGYMSPEQVRGESVDARSDLFALGTVLYEMLTGQQAFGRDTAAETMTAILKEDPPELTGSRPDISPSLDRITRHCLEKNQVERFQTARDVAFALEALSGSRGTSASAAPAPSSGRGWVRPVAIAALVVAAVALGGIAGRRTAPRAAPVTFERKTWDPMWVTNARFGPDGQTIVFSAAASGNLPELFVMRPGALLPQAVGQPAMHLLSVSSKGELAVITGARLLHHQLFSGTLARMTLDGAPRPWLDDVREADWSPDGSTLAVIHMVGGQDQIEYPLGQVRYRTAGGYLSDPRVSPDGTEVAFMEHATHGDDRGWVKLVAASGDVRTLAGEFWGEEGIAWSPDGRDVLFSASAAGGSLQTFRVNASGVPVVTQLVPNASNTSVRDAAADGRLLVVAGYFRTGIRALVPGERSEQELSWLDQSDLPSLSPAHSALLFTDLNQTAGSNYAVALRDLATGRTVRLGEGASFGLSPDGRWAGGLVMARQDLMLYPTGAGQPVHLARGPIEAYTGSPSSAQWFPDGKQILICGREKGNAPRCYRQDITGGAPQAVTPEGISNAWLSPDGTALVGDKGGGAYDIHRIDGGAAVPVRGLTRADSVFGWSADMQSVIVNVGNAVPARIESVNIASGARTFLRALAPPNTAGVMTVSPYQWFGAGYTYSYRRSEDAVYVVR